jgi:hypothetical protein
MEELCKNLMSDTISLLRQSYQHFISNLHCFYLVP